MDISMDSIDQLNGPPSPPSRAVPSPPPPSADAAGMDPLSMNSAGDLNGPPPPLPPAMPRPLPSLAGRTAPPPSLSAVSAAAAGVTTAAPIPGTQVAMPTREVGAATAAVPQTLDASAGTAIPLSLPPMAAAAAARAPAAALFTGPQVSIFTRQVGAATAVESQTLDATAAAVPVKAAPGAVPAAAMPSPVAVVGDKGGSGGGVPVDDAMVQQRPPQGEHVVVIGDPGAGKSTLLNTLCGGAAEFPSGLSIGTGLTTTAQSVMVKGTRFTDTPGLDDASKKEQAAQAIADAIRFGGDIKLLFVFTLESGRMRGSAIATVQVVLNALCEAEVDVGKRFTILLNKLSPAEGASWAASKEAAGADMSLDERKKGEKTTVSSWADGKVLCVPNESGLVDAANGMLSAASASLLTAHIADAPAVHIRPGTAVTIRTDQLAAASKEAGEQLAALEEAQRAELVATQATLRRSNEDHVALAVRNGHGAGGNGEFAAAFRRVVMFWFDLMCQARPGQGAPRG